MKRKLFDTARYFHRLEGAKRRFDDCILQFWFVWLTRRMT